jgi:hypothetical protein
MSSHKCIRLGFRIHLILTFAFFLLCKCFLARLLSLHCCILFLLKQAFTLFESFLFFLLSLSLDLLLEFSLCISIDLRLKIFDFFLFGALSFVGFLLFNHS